MKKPSIKAENGVNNPLAARLTMHIVLWVFISLSTSVFAQDKISAQLALELNSKETVDIYVLLHNQHAIKPYRGADRIGKLSHHIQQLKHNAAISQQLIKPLLESLTQDYHFFWVNNSFAARLDSEKAKQLLQHDVINKAYSNRPHKLMTLPVAPVQTEKSSLAVEWNVAAINAPQVWAQGIKGQDVIIAGQDTGYQWNHKSIKNQYAGFDGVNVNHNYHWHDAISNPSVACVDNQQNPVSCDDHGHGTHTMGTMVGDDLQGNQIGIAPQSKWIGCRNMDVGNGTPATYTECFQFFMQPTDSNGQNPDVSKAPHIINNSWGCPGFEGCVQPDALESVVNNVVDAGILVVVAAGNSGPGCNSVDMPPAIYQKSLSIGSITATDAISSFSSQGSVVVDGSNRIKPDIVAPGSDIRSAQLGGEYVTFSGTSMASPHVAGTAALMISANPAMAGQPKILKQVLLRTAQALTTQQNCNGILGSERPNNTFGWGKIDALKAVNEIKDIIFLDNNEEF